MSRTVLLAAVLVAFVLAFAAPAMAAVPWVTESPIAVAAGTQDAPFAYDYFGAIWEDDAAGDWDIVYSSTAPTVLPLGPSNQRHPVVSAGWIVYEDDGAGTWDIAACHFPSTPAPTPTPTPVATGIGDQLDPAIDGPTVVYEDNASGNWNVCAFNLATGLTKSLTSNTADQVDPAVSGDRVVYADHRNGNWDIYLYNLKTKKTLRLTSSKADQTAPQISGDIVAYQDHRNGNWDIYAYMIKTGVERRVTTNAADQTAPQVDTQTRHKIVVFQDDRSGNADIYLKDLSTGVQRPLTDDLADQTTPSVARTRVVWCDARGSDSDVYQGSIEIPSLSASGPANAPRYNATVTFRGHLADNIVGARIWKSGFGGTKSVVTGEYGAFSIAVPHIQRKSAVRLVFKGDATHLPALPVKLSVTPKALLTKPTLTLVPWTGVGFPPLDRSFVCSGYLKPHHRAGSSLILRCYAKDVFQNWHLAKTVKARLSNYAGYSRYTVTVKLNYIFGAKVQAIHDDADHARTLSAFSRTVSP